MSHSEMGDVSTQPAAGFLSFSGPKKMTDKLLKSP